MSIVVPCFNEEAVLPETARRLLELIGHLRDAGKVSTGSSVYFVDDGSKDRTWRLIEDLSKQYPSVGGIRLSRNRGHQNALMAGLLLAPGGVVISVDADLQDDLDSIEAMVDAHRAGHDIVYGVRKNRGVDTFFKRFPAQAYYRILQAMGVDVVFNHADFRLMSRRAIEALKEFKEVNLFLRGIIPQLGFATDTVYYDRADRFAGKSKYPLAKMLALAVQGITSFSATPLRMITAMGLVVSLGAFIVTLWAVVVWTFTDRAVPGWTSTVVPMYLLGGIQLLSLGVIGEYLAKIYMETKHRPNYIVETVLDPRSVSPTVRTAATGIAAPAFSLNRLAQQIPDLADSFIWHTNPVPTAPAPWFLHLGCGEQVLDGFVNLDFIPHDERVSGWNMLDLWPDGLTGRVEGVFSEDMLEHFFYAEQVYILCNINRVLRRGGIARTLMPSLSKLVDYSADYKPGPNELLHSAFGVETGADALNMGMRFSGHRWLHSPQSLARMAEICGFEVLPTTCAESSVERFNGINLRDETNSLSFANDLRKIGSIARTLLLPQTIKGASLVEGAAEGVQLFVATARRPTVDYEVPRPMASGAVACINIRSSNLSSLDEHSLKSLVIDDVHRDKPWYFDETLKSRSCMNLVTSNQLPLVIGDAQEISRLSFSPAAREGQYFALGCAEIFARD